MQPIITFLDRATLAPHINLRRLRFKHIWQEYPTTNEIELLDRLQHTHIAITNKVPLSGSTLSQLPALKLIAVAATGVNMIDMNHCRQQHITVCNIRNYATHSVTEHTFALILALRRQLPGYQRRIRQGEWENSNIFCLFTDPIFDLQGAQIGIIGGGTLGRNVARVAAAFGMRPVFSDRKGQIASGKPDYRPFDEVITHSDIISLHCPLTPTTKHLIAARELHMMKNTALLINTSRGNLIHEADLATALNRQQIAGAATDVVSQEPIQYDNPLNALRNHDHFILTPHTAWASDQAMQILADQLIDNLENFISGAPTNIVL